MLGLIGCSDNKMDGEEHGIKNYHYWIQKHDYSLEEFNNVTINQTIKAFIDYDWRSELASYIERSGDKDCPPGIGIHDGFDDTNIKGELLHICPYNETEVFFNYHYYTSEKILIFFKTNKDNIHYVKSYSKVKVPELIAFFFNNKRHKILEIK